MVQLLKGCHLCKRQQSGMVKSGGTDFPGGSVVRNLLPMQKTWVRCLVWEDSACCRAAEPVACSYRSPYTLKSVLHNKKSHCNEKVAHHN